MRIGIDCRLAGVAHAGLGRYIQGLVTQLLLDYPKVDWVLFLAQKQHLNLFPSIARFNHFIAPYRHYSLAEQWQMHRVFTDAKLNLLHVPHFNVPILYRGHLVVTIHDLLWHEQRGTHVTTLSPCIYWLKYFAYRLVVKNAVNRAAKIFVPSRTVAQTVCNFYPHACHKTVVTYEGVSVSKSSANAPTFKQPYLLYVGSLYPHKNVEIILKALANLSYDLVIVSSRDAFSTKFISLVEKYQLKPKVHILYQQDDRQLNSLYHYAQALVQPSFSEGFGLTGLEAMMVGAPVLASDISVFREIYQNGALYFNPNDVKSFINQVDKLGKAKNQLSKMGKKVVAQYSWQKTAQITFNSYLEALHNQ